MSTIYTADQALFDSVVRTRGAAPSHPQIRTWVAQVAELTQPDAIEYCDGSEQEWHRLIDLMVGQGVLVRLDPVRQPNSVYCRTDPGDVARVEERTFICSADKADAGPTNYWVDPAEMKARMTRLYDGCMRGRTMYVIPYCMGPLDADHPMFGVEISDSPYVVISMRIMTTMGRQVIKAMKAGDEFVRGLHSVGMPLSPGQADVPWPCNDDKYISHFPATREIWSYGSGYGGNSLLGKKCHALRIASAVARDEGWMAEHMLILKLTSPADRVHYVCAAFPSSCGKTNLAMLESPLDGWTVEMLGDDIAWLRVGEDGRLYATNPETGAFGVAPGTSAATNPNALRMIRAGNSIFTNVALTDDGDVWWEGLTAARPAHLTDWLGREWTPDSPTRAAHPNSRFTSPIAQCPIVADEYHRPNGVPIDAIIFGGRRPTTVPLVCQARDWVHGVFLGSACSSQTTTAAAGEVGVVRRDPMAMLPFIGYHVADYLRHWLDMSAAISPKGLPAIFYVNWFREDADGRFMWPGFGDNIRVLAWIAQRLEGRIGAEETPIGFLPAPGDLDVDGLGLPADALAELTRFDADAWAAEVPLIERWYEFLSADGKRVPAPLAAELAALKAACGRS